MFLICKCIKIYFRKSGQFVSFPVIQHTGSQIHFQSIYLNI